MREREIIYYVCGKENTPIVDDLPGSHFGQVELLLSQSPIHQWVLERFFFEVPHLHGTVHLFSFDPLVVYKWPPDSLKSSYCSVVVLAQTVLVCGGTKVVTHISALSHLASHSQMKSQCSCSVATYS